MTTITITTASITAIARRAADALAAHLRDESTDALIALIDECDSTDLIALSLIDIIDNCAAHCDSLTDDALRAMIDDARSAL